MPTPSQAFAAVAEALAGVDPRDQESVARFYRRQFVSYPPRVRSLISDFLTGQTGMPSASALDALKQAVAMPVGSVPDIDAPVWDEQFGEAMNYLPAAGPKVEAGG